MSEAFLAVAKYVFTQGVKKFVGNKLVIAIAQVALAAVITKRLAPKNPKSVRKQSLGRDVMVRSAITPRNIVYGQALVSRSLVYSNAAGTNNQDLWMLVAMVGHEISDITDVWLDGTKIAEADINSSWTAGEGAANVVGAGDFFVSGTDGVTFWKHLGSASQTHNADVLTAFGADWSTAHDGKEVAYLVSRFRLADATKTMFEAGAPQNIKALVQGKKDVYDPRLDSGGAGDDPTNASFQAYTTNPILCIANYLTDSALGMGFGTGRIDWTTVVNEANYCDTLVPNSTAGGMETRFTCNGALDTDVLHKENLKMLMSSCNGRLTVNAGQWIIRAGRLGTGASLVTNGSFATDSDWTKGTGWTIASGVGTATAATADLEQSISVTSASQYVIHFTIVTFASGTSITPKIGGTSGTARTAVGSYTEIITAGAGGSPELEFTPAGTVTATIDSVEVHAIGEIAFDDSWLAGDLAVNSGLTKESRFNTVHSFFFSEDDNYKLVQALQVQDSTALTRDNSEELVAELSLPFTATDDEAQRLGLRKILATDNEITVSAPCNYKALQVAIGDVLAVTISAYSWTSKLFRVVGWVFNDLGTSQQGIELTLIEESVGAYKDASTADFTTLAAPAAVTFASFSGSDPTVKTVTVAAPPAQQFTTDGTTYAPTSDLIVVPIVFSGPTAEIARGTVNFDLTTGSETIAWTDGDLITNGAFAADTDWTKGAGWSIGSGVATGATASTDLEQTVSIAPGLTYELVFTMTVSAGTVTPKIGGNSGTARSTAATFTETITAGGANSLIEFTGAGFSGTIDDVTLNGSHGEAVTTALVTGFTDASNSVAVDVTHTASGLVGRAHAWLASTEAGGGGGK